MSVISDVLELKKTLHSIFDNGSSKDEQVCIEIFDELKKLGGDFNKNARLIIELLKQKVSGEPMDDRSMIVSLS